MTWKQLTERDCREWMLSAIDPHDRDTWRSGMRSTMHAASQEGGPLLWIYSLYLHVNKKSDDDDFFYFIYNESHVSKIPFFLYSNLNTDLL